MTPESEANRSVFAWPPALLSVMMLLVPALGVRGEELLQDTLKSMLVAFFTLLTAIVFFWKQGRTGDPVHWHGVLFLPLALMLYAAASMSWSHAYLGGVEAVRWFLFSLIMFLGMHALTLERVVLLAWGIHAGASIASLWTALQFWIDFGMFAQYAAPASTFVNRNFFAEFLVCTLPFSVWLTGQGRARIPAFLLIVSMGLNIVALMMTGSRSALLGLLLLSFLVPVIVWNFRRQWVSHGWRRGHAITAGLLLISMVGILGAINTGNPKLIAEQGRADALDRALRRAVTMTQSEEYTQGSFSVRARMWRATTRMIQAHPLAGVGAGAWEVQIPLFQEEGSQLETDFYAHNEPLQLVAEYGVLGWLFLLVLLSYLAVAARRTWSDRSLVGSAEGSVRALTLASLLVFLLVSNAGFPWRMASTGALFALALSVLLASDLRRGRSKEFWRLQAPWQPIHVGAAVGLSALCLILAVHISWQAIACEGRLVRAYKLATAVSRSVRPNDPQWERIKIEIVRLMREAIAINPHYRKITPLIADEMSSWGDWKNAAWIWDSVLTSRPHVVALAANISRALLELGDERQARVYLDRAARVQPAAPAVRSLQAQILIREGHYKQAAEMIGAQLQTANFDDSYVNMAYQIGRYTQQWELAILALRQRIAKLPQEASSAWLHLGNIYARPELNNEAKALESYRFALDTAPRYLKDEVWVKIPPSYRAGLSTPD